MFSLPFALRRPFLILRDLIASRERPDLHALAEIEEPERFVWAILPHAARTFAACITLLPARSARAAAVAYLYCRVLDTYEDLVPDRTLREHALRDFAARFDVVDGPLPPAPTIADAADRDDRDRAHLLLVHRVGLVDQVFASLEPATRLVVRDLVRDMAEGMQWSSATFAAHAGVLPAADLARYCRHVLGNPVVFSVRLLRMRYGASPDLAPADREDAMLVGEMVQLANITRDIEKDLRRGIAYDPALRPYLGRDARTDVSMRADIDEVRGRLVRFALSRAPAYRRVVDGIHLPKRSVARASAVLMLLFTERHFRHCARSADLPAWDGPESTLELLARSVRAAFSAARANREMLRVEQAFANGIYPRTPTWSAATPNVNIVHRTSANPADPSRRPSSGADGKWATDSGR